jgi:hypothetical protein
VKQTSKARERSITEFAREEMRVYSDARFPVVQDSSQGLEGAKADEEANANAQCENTTSVEV